MSDIKNEIQAKLGELAGVRACQAEAKAEKARRDAAFQEEYGYTALNKREEELANEIRDLAIQGHEAGETFDASDGVKILQGTEIIWHDDLAVMMWLAKNNLLWLPKVDDKTFKPVYEPVTDANGDPVTGPDGAIVYDPNKPVYHDVVRIELRSKLGGALRPLMECGVIPGVEVVYQTKAEILSDKKKR